MVFVAASLALVVTTAIGVLAGAAISSYVQPNYLGYAAGIGFILIGTWTIWWASDQLCLHRWADDLLPLSCVSQNEGILL